MNIHEPQNDEAHAYNIGFAIWWLTNMCQAIVILLNFSNNLKLTRNGMPPHRKAVPRVCLELLQSSSGVNALQMMEAFSLVSTWCAEVERTDWPASADKGKVWPSADDLQG